MSIMKKALTIRSVVIKVHGAPSPLKKENSTGVISDEYKAMRMMMPFHNRYELHKKTKTRSQVTRYHRNGFKSDLRLQID